MKYRFLSIIKDFVSLALDCIFIYATWISLMGAFGARPSPALPAGMVFLPLVLYFFRKYVKKLYIYLPLHLLAAVCALIYSLVITGADENRIPELLVTVPVIVFLTVNSFVVRVKTSEPGKEPVHPIVAAIVWIFCIIVLNYTENGDLARCVYICAVIFGALYFAYLYLERFIWFDFMNRKIITDMPTEKLLKAGAPYIAGFSLFYVFAAVLWMNEGLIKHVTDVLRTLVTAIMRFLISLFPQKETEITEIEPVSETFDMPFMQADPGIDGRSPFWELVQKLFVYLLLILAASAFAALFVSFVIRLIRHFHGTDDRKGTDISTGYVEEHEKIERKSSFEKHERRLFLSPAERIRKLYVIIAGRNPFKNITPGKITARDFAQHFSEEKKPAAMEFAGIYEKARYSPHVCTAEDVRRAKALADLLK